MLYSRQDTAETRPTMKTIFQLSCPLRSFFDIFGHVMEGEIKDASSDSTLAKLLGSNSPLQYQHPINLLRERSLLEV